MKSVLLIVLLILIKLNVFSQAEDITINGKVKLSENELVEGAYVYLKTLKGNLVRAYSVTNKQGEFTIQCKAKEEQLNLFISYLGYHTYSKKIVMDSIELDLETIVLKKNEQLLAEFSIEAEAVPIIIKKDFIAFNANSFKTKKDANIEDLLKVLPGIEIDDDGKIRINGKEVNKVLVNGKPFFEGDPTIVTKNLTKEMVKTVQVLNTKTKGEVFANEEGDNEHKTINLIIKQEKNKGLFGHVEGGLGTSKRYQTKGLINKFNNKQQLSFLGGNNNVNASSFNSGGGDRGLDGVNLGGNQGPSTVQNYGVNYADALTNNIDISGDYFHSNANINSQRVVERESILPDSRFFTNRSSNSRNKNDNDRFNLGVDLKLDSTLLINVKSLFNLKKSSNQFTGNQTVLNEDQTITNQSFNTTSGEGKTENLENRVNLTKLLGEKRALLRFNASHKITTTENDRFSQLETIFFDTISENIFRDQMINEEFSTNELKLSTTYKLPLRLKKAFINVGFDYQKEKKVNKRNTFDKDESGSLFTLFNSNLSRDFNDVNQEFTPSLQFLLNREEWSVSFKANYVYKTLENEDFLRPMQSLKRNFETVELQSQFNYRFNAKTAINGNYNLNNISPQLAQLRTFQNNDNPLNIIVGNPNLKMQNNHSINLGMNTYDFEKRRSIFFYVNLNLLNNQVIAKSTIEDNFVRKTTYVNVNGGFNISGSVNYNKKIEFDSTFTFKFKAGLDPRINRAVNFNNDIKYTSNLTSLTPKLDVAFNWENIIELNPQYQVSFNRNTYNIEAFEQNSFLRHQLRLATTIYISKNFEWQNDVLFTHNSNVNANFQRSSWFWNSAFVYSFIKNKAAITLTIYDVLNQNVSSRRIATSNYIEDSQSNVLQQYAMISFRWKISRFGK